MMDEYRLQRFVEAQDAHGTYADAVEELRRGRKTSHWMWFIFPQIAGLGQSQLSRQFAISNLAEARAYLEHPVLGPRLRECAQLVTALDGVSAVDVFGSIDAQKLQSSITLFGLAAPGEKIFKDVLDQYFDGIHDEATTSRAN